MATWTSRTTTVTRRQWIVPAADPHGACLGDMGAAINAASEDYRHYFNYSDFAALPDDALSFTAEGDSIVISFTIESPQP